MAATNELLDQELNSTPLSDRFCTLPDEILINILNFLPTKFACATIVLSKRWRYLFKEVKHLAFDDSLLFDTQSAFDHRKHCDSFRAFVDKMLDCCKLSGLITFRLRCSAKCPQCNSNSVGPWLEIVLSLGIQELDLCIDGAVHLPPSIFSCRTLHVIKLNVFSNIEIPESVYLPCLRIIRLKHVWSPDADSITRLFLGCPLLEEYLTEQLSSDDVDVLSISAPSLTKLKLDNREGIAGGHSRSVVAIDAPLLQNFKYVDNLAKGYSIQASNYLVTAHLNVFVRREDLRDAPIVSHSILDLIQGVSSVKCLFMSANSLEAVTHVIGELPTLRNLTKLVLGCSICLQWHLSLVTLLKSAPYLEELVFPEGLYPAGSRSKDAAWRPDYWESREDVPSCMSTHLKIIEIEHFLGLREELQIIMYFLSNSQVLTQLVIHKWLGRRNRAQLRHKLKNLARRSNVCLTTFW